MDIDDYKIDTLELHFNFIMAQDVPYHFKYSVLGRSISTLKGMTNKVKKNKFGNIPRYPKCHGFRDIGSFFYLPHIGNSWH